MANPSATPASSAGSEILRRSHVVGLSTTPVKLIDGASADYTYILLTVTFCENSGADEAINMKIDTEASGADVFLLDAQALLSKETFIWNDKLMLWGTDELVVYTGSAANIDVYCTYIEQRWA